MIEVGNYLKDIIRLIVYNCNNSGATTVVLVIQSHQYVVLQITIFCTFIKSCKQRRDQLYKYDKLLNKLLEFKLPISKLYSLKRFHLSFIIQYIKDVY